MISIYAQVITSLRKHTDLIEVSLVGSSGFTLVMTNIELVLKIAIAAATLGFIIYKWRCAYLDRKSVKK